MSVTACHSTCLLQPVTHPLCLFEPVPLKLQTKNWPVPACYSMPLYLPVTACHSTCLLQPVTHPPVPVSACPSNTSHKELLHHATLSVTACNSPPLPVWACPSKTAHKELTCATKQKKCWTALTLTCEELEILNLRLQSARTLAAGPTISNSAPETVSVHLGTVLEGSAVCTQAGKWIHK